MFSGNLSLVMVVWMMVLGLISVIRTKKHTAGVGLVLAFLLNLWLIHWSGAVIYLLPWYAGGGEAFTILGAEQSLYGVLGFAFGSLALTPFLLDSGLLPRVQGHHAADPRLPKAYLICGGVFYVLLSTSFGALPSMTAIISSGQSLAVVGLSLCCWQAWANRDSRRMALWLGMAFLPPFLTVITRGFIGYGAIATLSVLIFLSNFVRRRTTVVVAGVLLGYLALSVYVSYMRDRGEIRQSVWGGQSLSDRLDRLVATASTFEWFSVWDQLHLQRVDSRLNQDYFVGAAVARIEETGDYARGETLRDAALSLIPRVLWPDKPITAGSGNLVSRFTGIQFNSSTSVGIGQVMEFYVNFGSLGVFLGFVVLGVIVTALDVLATERLMSGDLQGFVLFYLPGLSFLQVGGQLVEVTAGAAGAIIAALLVNKYLDRLQRQHADRGGLPLGVPV